MTKFNYLSDICGSDKAFCARIRLIENVDVDKGDLVYFDETALGATPVKSDSAVRIGVCAENYRAASSELVPTDGSGSVSVIVSADALYRVDPVIITDSGVIKDSGICTDISADALTDITGIVGSKLVLIHKEQDSVNTASLGSVHTITAAKLRDGSVAFETDTAVKGSAGDRYAFVPPYGFELFELDGDGVLALQFEKKGSFTVVDATEKAYVLKIHGIR